jgi:hypothetical protein
MKTELIMLRGLFAVGSLAYLLCLGALLLGKA